MPELENKVERRRRLAKHVLLFVLVLIVLLLGYIIYYKACGGDCVAIHINTAPIGADLTPMAGIEDFVM